MNAGERLGPWIIEAEIGRGAMGSVWRARHSETGTIAAVKLLMPELARDELFVKRFRREIEALGQLSHPNIVRFLEAGEDAGHFYYAMEYVDGQDCEAILRERGRLPPTEVLAVARQVVAALKHAHDRGVIHRDLKPANLIVAHDAEATVKLTDFGVAKLFARPPITAAGSFVGTAAYLAPELATGKPATKRTDFYSLGGVLYALLCGRPPFPGENVIELLHKHCHAKPEHPRWLVPEIPHDIDDLVMQMLEKDPMRRPADGSVLIRQIERIARKLARQAEGDDVDPAQNAPTVQHEILPSARLAAGRDFGGKGPATVAADLMREELAALNRGGPVQRFFNHPATLVGMLLLCVGLIAWGIWRPRATAESLYRQAEPLMASEREADRERAWHDYLEPLEAKFPGHAHSHEVAAFRHRMLDESQLERAVEKASIDPQQNEAERWYRLGLAYLQMGDIPAARRVWNNLVAAFGGLESSARWVGLAGRGLTRLDQATPSRDAALTQAAERVKQLRANGQGAEADRIVAALAALYGDDPAIAKLKQAEK
ncbi:MAG: serine/threonine-protein kinase [Gemmataceae bacterium]